MKRNTYLLIVCLLCVKSLFGQEDPQKRGNLISFNDNWQFIKDPDTSIRPILFKKNIPPLKWESIALPHTANIEPILKVAQQWQGNSFYRKFFTLTQVDASKHITIRLDAAMSDVDIYLNGKFIKNHKGGYLPFEIELDSVAKFGAENCLLLRLTNQDNPDITPGKAIKDLDFNWYSGLYRNAWISKKNQVYITDAVTQNSVNSGGLLIHYDSISTDKAFLTLKAEVKNNYPSGQPTRLKSMLYDPYGKLIKSTNTQVRAIPAGKTFVFQQKVHVANPALWSPEKPQLYRLVVALETNGKIVDSTSLRTGIRQIAFKADGFYLNNEKYMIRGTNRHQEYPYVGYALSDNAQYRDAYKIKAAGFNFVRCSHYPPSPEFLNACDELGIMVMNSIPGWQFFGGDTFQKNSLQDIRDMIHRDRNHPSIILWESSLNETAMTQSYMEQAQAIVHTELPYSDTYTCGWMDTVYDVFIPARQHAKAPDYWSKYNKKKPILIAEYGDWEYYAQNAGFNQTSYADLTEEEKTSRQLRGAGQKRLLQQALNFQEAHNDNLYGPISGDANWLMFDYKRGYAPDIESSGIMDIFRLPKFSYYFYRSQLDFNAIGPMLFIANYWQDAYEKTVKIYSNCDEVELFLNGRSLGKRRPDKDNISKNLQHPPFTFPINYQAGTILAKGYVNGQEVIKSERRTPETASSLSIEVDSSGKEIGTSAGDLVFVYVSIKDKNGTVIPNAENSVQLSTNSTAEIIGASTVNAEAGIAAFLIKTGAHKSPIRLTATANGLTPGKWAVAEKN
jgi:beta-galactosidase